MLVFRPIRITGDLDRLLSCLRTSSAFSPGLARTDRVFHEPDLVVTAGPGTETLAERGLSAQVTSRRLLDSAPTGRSGEGYDVGLSADIGFVPDLVNADDDRTRANLF